MGVINHKGQKMPEQINAVTAGVILIGNELLSGQTLDKNLGHIAKTLFPLGIYIKEATVIPDCKDTIIKTVRNYSNRFTYVFTTGGIGPTHDDITSESIAAAFNLPHVLHPEAHKILAHRYNEDELNASRLRMAMMPEGAALIENTVSKAPGFRIKNVYVMAGIPSIMHSMLEHSVPTLKCGKPLIKKMVFCDIVEGLIAGKLQDLQNAYPGVEIGSYPHWPDGKPQGVRITLIGLEPHKIEQAGKELLTICQSYGAHAEFIEA